MCKNVTGAVACAIAVEEWKPTPIPQQRYTVIFFKAAAAIIASTPL